MQVLINVVLSFILALIITWVYQRTHRGLSYSQSFVFTLIILAVVVTLVMMVIGHSLARAFTLLGAFSLIRFRTAVKDTKDTAFVFFSLVMGLAVGTQNYLIAIVGTILVGLIILWLNKKNFGSFRKYDYILNFYIDAGVAADKTYLKLFNEFLSSQTLLNINHREKGAVLELVFDIKFFSDKENEKFVRELGAIGGVSNVRLLTAKNDIEY
jgi:hypothetical protein